MGAEKCDIAEPWPGIDRARRVCLSVLLVCAVMLGISFATARQNRTIFGNPLGGDWIAFYGAGTIANQFGPSRLYDASLQSRLYHQHLPDEPASASLPYAYPPFVALLLRPLAMLPYAWSFGVWVVISLTLFIAAIALAWRAARLPRQYFGLGLLVCLSFEPLAIECIHGGQVSAIGMLLIVAAISLHLNGRALLAGLVLAGCFYKPTLLPIVLAMLLLGRQWRVLIGFVCGGGALALATLAAAGVGPCVDYLHLLAVYAGQSTAPAAESVFRCWKFVDLNSFLKLLNVPPLVIGLTFLSFGGVALRSAWRAMTWSDTGRLDPDDRLRLSWAAALTLTLVLNIYVGIYDTVLLIPALLLTAGVVSRTQKPEDERRWTSVLPSAPIPLPLREFRLVCMLAYILPWISQFLARETGYQPYTLGLLLAAVFQHRLAVGGTTFGARSDNTKVSCVISTMSRV